MSIFKYFKFGLSVFIITLAIVFFTSEGYSVSPVNKNSIPAINSLLNNINVKSGQTFKNMTIYPIEAKIINGETFLLLDESMKNGTLEIEEKGSGDVNNLKLQKNTSKYPVYIMAGEIVQGAKQDRVISNDLVLGTDSKTYDIAVYCVEQGRWVKKSEKFAPAPIVASQSLRSKVVQNKSQRDVWSEVSKKNRSMGASSETSNFKASYEGGKYKEEASEYVNHFVSLAKGNEKYVGAIVKLDNKISNMDIFGDHKTFEELWPKLIKSYAQDAVDQSYISSIPKVATSQDFLDTLNSGDFDEIANPGLGNEYKIVTSKTKGSVLTYKNKVAHIALFADSNTEETTKIPFNNMQTQQQNYNDIPNINRPLRR